MGPAVMAVLAIPLFWAAVRHGQDPGNAIPSYVWLIAAWAAGRSVRGWRLKSITGLALAAANRELAERRELQARERAGGHRRHRPGDVRAAFRPGSGAGHADRP